MSDIKDWSTTATQNNDSPPDGFPEGMAPSAVNNSAREVMASVREYYDNPEWRDWGHTITYGSATTFTTSAGNGDTTAIYHANRRVRAVGTLTTTIYGSVSSSSHSSQTTVTVVWDSGSLNNESLAITVGATADTKHIPEEALDIPASYTFETGTSMVFHQASAPTYWTQDATHNDKALRVVSGTGGGNGGTHGLSSPPTSSHTHTGPSHLHTGPSHLHSVGSHVHKWYDYTLNAIDKSYNSVGGNENISRGADGFMGISASTSTASLDEDYYTATSSGNTGSSGTGNTGSSGTGNTGTGTLTAFAPLYVDVIIASKDA